MIGYVHWQCQRLPACLRTTYVRCRTQWKWSFNLQWDFGLIFFFNRASKNQVLKHIYSASILNLTEVP